jgi:hypothetical protein
MSTTDPRWRPRRWPGLTGPIDSPRSPTAVPDSLEPDTPPALLKRMEHLACGAEYDVEELGTPGWRRDRIDARCEVCGAVLKRWNANVHYALIMTKHGDHRKAG